MGGGAPCSEVREEEDTALDRGREVANIDEVGAKKRSLSEHAVRSASSRGPSDGQIQKCKDATNSFRERHAAMLGELHSILANLDALKAENAELRGSEQRLKASNEELNNQVELLQDFERNLRAYHQESIAAHEERVQELQGNEQRLVAANEKLAEKVRASNAAQAHRIHQLEVALDKVTSMDPRGPGPGDFPPTVRIGRGLLERRHLGFWKFSWYHMYVSLSGGKLVVYSEPGHSGFAPVATISLHRGVKLERTSPQSWLMHEAVDTTDQSLLNFEWRAPTSDCADHWIHQLKAACEDSELFRDPKIAIQNCSIDPMNETLNDSVSTTRNYSTDRDKEIMHVSNKGSMNLCSRPRIATTPCLPADRNYSTLSNEENLSVRVRSARYRLFALPGRTSEVCNPGVPLVETVDSES